MDILQETCSPRQKNEYSKNPDYKKLDSRVQKTKNGEPRLKNAAFLNPDSRTSVCIVTHLDSRTSWGGSLLGLKGKNPTKKNRDASRDRPLQLTQSPNDPNSSDLLGSL